MILFKPLFQVRHPISVWLGLSVLLGMGWLYFQQQRPSQPPEAILVLGGRPQRERFAAEFSRKHPDLPIWVSSGSDPDDLAPVFQAAAIKPHLVHLDYEAVDTLTNFTTVVDKLHAAGIDSIYLITSDYHMRRARLIGEIILGSRGISLHPIVVPSGLPEEPLTTAVLDGTRAILWLTTNKTGGSLKPKPSASPTH